MVAGQVPVVALGAVVVREVGDDVAPQHVQQLVVALGVQLPRGLGLVIVARQREVHVVVGRPVVAGVADELASLLVEAELDLRKHETRVAARLDHRPGRSWRNLQDTADAAAQLYSAPHQWDSWRRDVDFYDEGELLWLDVDTTIRQLTHGQKSLDDFTHVFHGAPGGPPQVKPYEFDDVAAALNQVAPNDWKIAPAVSTLSSVPPNPMPNGCPPL